MDIEEFYDADPRRRQSAEVEFGRDWSDEAGGRAEVSWVVDTGELYVMNEPIEPVFSDGLGDVAVEPVHMKDMTVEILAVIPSRSAVDAVLDGWQDAMGTPNSIAWVRERALHPPADTGDHTGAEGSTIEVPGASPPE
ncbi:MAG TPA: hypothetical protein VFC99_02450 [Acidimicrobiia bacterium]|nr:hypothetical protein [Acidimicrobiia bacterium]